MARIDGLATLSLLAALLAAGCRTPEPSVASNVRLDEETGGEPYLGPAKPLLNAGEQDRLEAAMRGVAAGYTSTSPPRGAPGGRWRDVPRAVGAACSEAGVEMAVVGMKEAPDTYRFELSTVEDWPGALVVRRAPSVPNTGPQPPALEYEAEVSIGLFPDRPDRRERGEALLRALERWLRLYGEEPAFDEPEDARVTVPAPARAAAP